MAATCLMSLLEIAPSKSRAKILAPVAFRLRNTSKPERSSNAHFIPEMASSVTPSKVVALASGVRYFVGIMRVIRSTWKAQWVDLCQMIT